MTEIKLALLALDIQVQVSRSVFLTMISFLLGRVTSEKPDPGEIIL